MRILFSVLFLLFFSLQTTYAHANISITDSNFTPEEYTYLKQKKRITMCIDPDWMPFEKIEDGKHIGMTAEHFKLFEKEIGIPIVMIPTKTWSESIEFAKNRKCDIFSLAMETKERKEYMNFTSPYLEAPLVITTRIHTTFISDPKDVIHKPLGITKGYAFIELLKEKYPEINLVEFETLNDGLDSLRKGEVFGYIDNLITSGYKIQQKYFGELKIAGKFDDIWALGIGVRNDDEMLLGIMQKAINLISYDEYNSVINKWLSIRYDKGFDYNLFWEILLFVIIGILLFTYRHFTLQKYITKLKEQEIELKRLTIVDPLTGLYNRRHFDNVMLHEFDRAKRNNNQFVFALLDIDYFKKYNDTYGHQAGDDAIRQVSKILKNHTKRSGDFAFRVGGEEFAIILQSSNLEDSSSYFNKICKSIEELNIEHTQNLQYVHLTISIGVTNVSSYDNLTIDGLYKFTDEQLYHAKRNGRNKIQVATL